MYNAFLLPRPDDATMEFDLSTPPARSASSSTTGDRPPYLFTTSTCNHSIMTIIHITALAATLSLPNPHPCLLPALLSGGTDQAYPRTLLSETPSYFDLFFTLLSLPPVATT